MQSGAMRRKSATARPARKGRSVLRVTVLLAGLFHGAASCTTPEQPDLNTYGAIQPVCLFACFLTHTLTEGDGSSGSYSSTVSTATTGGDKL